MSDLRVRVVGSSSAVPRPGRACSAYLVESNGARVMVDFGTGAIQSLRKHIECAELDAIVISHMHPDHYMDLVQLRFALKLGTPPRQTPLPVALPPGGLERMNDLGKVVETGQPFWTNVLDLYEYDPAFKLTLADLTIEFAKTLHYIDAYAMRIQSNSTVITYSADTAPCDAVIHHARNTDLFICETALGPTGTDYTPRGHSNAAEAGQMAAAARTKHLLLTHYASQFDPQALAAAASQTYAGKITVADDGMEFAV